MALAVLGDVAILRGVDASKPSDNATGVNGTQGRLYFATDTGKAYRDNGTSWDELHIIDNVTTAAHIADTSAAHAASAIGFTPAGAIASTDVQAAIAELDTEKQPINSDLTAIAGLSPSNDDVIQRKAGAWANRTIAQLIADIIAAGAWTEAVQDVIGAMVAAAGGSYNDGANTITLPSGFTNPMTTQDDIIVGAASGTPDRLAKGSDGQVLTVDPTTHHLIWATPTGGGAALTVEEVDGSPTDGAITKIVFPNGTLGIASHVATYTPAAVGIGAATTHLFHATRSADTAGTGDNAFHQVTFNTETYDLSNEFASNVYTPTLAGKYRLTASLLIDVSGLGSSVTVILALRKNGTTIKRSRLLQPSVSAAVNVSLAVSADVDANGSTDNFDVVYLVGSGTVNLNSGEYAWFCGGLIQGA